MKTIVIGGGAIGLACAHLLRRTGREVTVLEASRSIGGLMATFEIDDGLRLEHYYHHFFTHDAEIHWLLDELGLHDRIVYRPTSMGVFRDSVVYPFDSPLDLLFRFRPLSILDRLRFGATSAALAYTDRFLDAEDIAAFDWFTRRAGRASVEAIWGPMLRIKFGEAAEKVPLAWMAGRLRQRVRSRRAGEERLGYLSGSLQVLVETWLAKLTGIGVDIRAQTPVLRLLHDGGRVVGVATQNEEIRADEIVATIPGPIFTDLVREIDAEYAAKLERIRYMGAICSIFMSSAGISPVYWLNVADPGYDFGGVIEHTNFIPASEYRGKHLTYLSRYLEVTDPLWTTSDAELTARHLNQLEQMFGNSISSRVEKCWVFRARYAAPRVELGFHNEIPTMRTPIPGLFGANMCHIYPDERSVNNSIRVAAECVRAMGCSEAADLVPKGFSLAAKYGKV